jgi:TRAP-type C4-dicarboxylate transport system permease small subunit
MANSENGHRGSFPSEHGLRIRVRAAWDLSKPLNNLAEADERRQRLIRLGRIERWQLVIASVFFVATAASVVVEVFFRFVLNQPQVWSLELPTYLFFWSFSFASGLSDWRDDQIGFPLLAERLPRRLRLVGSAVANVLIVVPLAIVLPGTLSFLSYEAGQPNTGLPLTQVWGFAGVLLLFGIAILLRGRLCFLQVRELVRPRPGEGGDTA